ncbi:hypothetical protein HYU22_05420 [Candidatus Woesearchaeota archaeon]|nr:hypothetical protein [Candidatus Woesearchaeota archaeon]
MGWLFGAKKKAPAIPFPEGRVMDENALRLPGRISADRVIEPEQLKQAAGIETSSFFPRNLPPPSPVAEEERSAPRTRADDFVYVKVDIYQQVLGELELMKVKIAELQETHQHLETSEYNEEENFVKLRRSMKSMHDRFLLIDKTIFKTQGD